MLEGREDSPELPTKTSRGFNLKSCLQIFSLIQDLLQGSKDAQPALNEIGEDFVTACIEEIERRGLSVEGLYRKPALNKKVSELLNYGLRKKNRIFSLDLDEYDTKVLTNCVKLYLNSLPEALLTVVVYPSIIQAVRSNDLTQLHNAVHKIPAQNFAILEKLMRHFHRIVQHSPENLMTANNLSKIFGHILLRPKAEDITFAELGIEMLINNYEHIFNNGIRTYQPSDEMKHILNKKLLKIFIGTWNVGNHPITNEAALTDWLHPTSKKFLPPDVYAIGFQELDLSKDVILYNKSLREKEWLSAISICLESLPENYTQVEVVRMVGTMLVIFVRDSCLPRINNVDKSEAKSGPLGNKGGVAIRFELNRRSFCFICCHFQAHISQLKERNSDFKNILNHINFQKTNKLIPDHDLIFWFGDLNYRLDGISRNSVLQLINTENYEDLLQYDQLRNIVGKSNSVFPGFKEADIGFKPTYKYVPGTLDEFAQHRIPAYCDRILWRGRHVKNYFYKSHNGFTLSDHKPVSGFFLCKIKIEGQTQSKVNLESYQNKVLVDKRKLDFGIVKFMQLFQDSITVTNLKTVPVGFQFVDQKTLNKYNNQWLKISPKNGIIDPGEEENIVFTLQITESFAAKFNAGEEVIKDRFYLRISGEKDTSIKINGQYRPSVFGFSMTSLAKLKKPLTEMTVEELRAIEQKDYSWVGKMSLPDVPKCLIELIDSIFRNSLEEENLFVKGGNYFEIIQIRDWLDASKNLSQISVSGCSVAQCILLLLKSTRDPLIRFEATGGGNLSAKRQTNASTSSIENGTQVTQSLNPKNCFQMTKYNQFLVKYIVGFLCYLLTRRKQNKLNVKILAEVFAEALIHSTDVEGKKYVSKLILDHYRSDKGRKDGGA